MIQQILFLFMFSFALAEPNPTIANLLSFCKYPFLHNLISSIITEECYSKFVVDGDLFDQHCLKYSISKCLGYGIIVASAILKMPQIINIIRYHSVKGLSCTSFYLECFAFIPSVVYNILNKYPISTYGESVIILIQNILLVFMFWSYADKDQKQSLSSKLLFLLALPGSILLLSIVPPQVVYYQYCLPYIGSTASVLARLPQIINNFKQQHTGTLSLLTWLLTLAGNFARLYTIITEVNDPSVIISTCMSTFCNVILVLQILIYWRNTNKFLKEKQA